MLKMMLRFLIVALAAVALGALVYHLNQPAVSLQKLFVHKPEPARTR